jgi:hypothetical protein
MTSICTQIFGGISVYLLAKKLVQDEKVAS